MQTQPQSEIYLKATVLKNARHINPLWYMLVIEIPNDKYKSYRLNNCLILPLWVTLTLQLCAWQIRDKYRLTAVTI